jgi:hypothetical protein
MANSFNLGNGNWAQKTEKLLAYNAENDNYKPLPFDFDRASTATVVNKNGLIETVGTDEPRIDFTNYSKGALLLEPQRLNYVLYSNEFDNSYWSKATSDSTPNPTVTANAAIAPDGTQTADKIDLTAPPSGEWSVIKRDGINTGATVGSKLQQSLYLKAYDSSQVGKNVDVYMYDFSNTVYKTVYKYTLTADWQRVVVEHTITGANTSTNIQFAFGKARNTVGGSTQAEAATDFLVWGVQFESGNYPTSYIPTSGSAVTRTEDFCYINSGLQNTLNTSEGTLFVDVEVPRVSSTSDFDRIVLSDQNASTDRIIFDNFGGNWRALMLSGANNVNKTIVNVTANQRIKVAIAYSSTQLRISYDGNTATTTSGSYTPTTTLESLKFSNKDGGSKWQGKIYEVKYFNTALTDAELIALTSN